MRTRSKTGALLGAAALLCSIWAPAPARATNANEWPLYGHDIANSRDGGDGPSPAQALTLTRVWDRQVPSAAGSFTGTPVIADGTLIVGSSHGTVFALDAKTGALKWSRNLNPGADPRLTINGSAAIAGGRAYVPVADAGHPRVVAFDLASGSIAWDRVLDTQKDADVFGSPVVYGGTLYIGVSGYYGELTDSQVSVRGSVVALDAATGGRRWKTYTVPPGFDGGAVWSTPAIDPHLGRLFVGTGNAYHPPAAGTTDSVLALKLSNGRMLAHFQATPDDVWNATTASVVGSDFDFGASPNLIASPGGRPLVGEGQKSGTYWALDRRTLAPVWHTFAGPGGFLGGILGSTAYDGQRIYGPETLGGELFALGRGGDVEWLSAEPDPLHFNPVTVANGVAYSTDMAGSLTARDAATGVVLAKQPLSWGAEGGVAVADGTVYAVTGTSGLPQLDTSGVGHVEAFRPFEGSSPLAGEVRLGR
jgi:polyvinyl alcohol dehydrogenase (cytochrome)